MTETVDEPGAGPASSRDHAGSWKGLLRDNVRVLGGWLVRGLGGFLGLIGSAVILLSFVFYMLHTRSEWIDRLIRMLALMGLRPRREGLERARVRRSRPSRAS